MAERLCRKAKCIDLAGGPGLVAHYVSECPYRKPSWCRREACVDLAMGQTTHRAGECRRAW